MFSDLIPELLIYICQYVAIETMISLRRINKHFDHVLGFDIASIDGQIVFRYNYKWIEKIVCEQITPTMNGFISWYIQSLNISLNAPIWHMTGPHQNPITSKNIVCGKYNRSTTIEYINNSPNFDASCSMAVTLKEYYMKIKFSCLVWKNDDGMMVQFPIDDSNFVTDIFRHLHCMTEIADCILQQQKLDYYSPMFQILLLGYLYDIKPITKMLKRLLENSDKNSDAFFDALHCNKIVPLTNSSLILVGTNEKCYSRQQLWQDCVELHSCFSLGHVSQFEGAIGQFGWIGEMCMFGDFTIYEKCIKIVQQKCKNEQVETNTGENTYTPEYGYGYRGVASLMVMYKRYDLLYNYRQDQAWFVESPLTMLSFAILPIKTEWCYQYFTLVMNIKNVHSPYPDFNVIDCLKILWCLIWSTKFAMVLCSPRFDLFAAKNYIETREFLIDMFNDQSIFEGNWELDKLYACKKRELWQQFKDIIQGLFTIPHYYLKKEKDEDGWRRVNKHFQNEYNIRDSYLDEMCDTIEDFEGYYSKLEQVLPGNNVFDEPFVDDIIIENFKKHQDVLNMQDVEPFELPKITTTPKKFVRKLFDMFSQNP